jgi:succinoglycan biosynthesis transport protein ExoP
MSTRLSHRRRIGQAATGLTTDLCLEIWRRRKWIAILAFAAAAVGAVTVALSLPDVYRAKATVLVAHPQVSEEFVRSAVTTEFEARIQTLQQQVMSRERLTDLITRLNLYPHLREKVRFETIVETMRGDVRLDFKGADTMSGRRPTIAFAVTYTGRDAQTVALVANTLAEAYVEANLNSRALQSAQTAEFLKQQLAQTKLELAKHEERVSEFKLRHGVELPEQSGSNLAVLERLNAQLRLNGEYQIRAMERRERLETQFGMPAAGLLESGAGGAAMPLAKRKQELALLQRQFSDLYPDVIRLKAEIAALEQQAAAAVQSRPVGTNGHSASPDAPASGDTNGSHANGPANSTTASTSGSTNATGARKQAPRSPTDELSALRQQEAFLRRAIAGYESRIENAPLREQELQRLSLDYKTTKDLYETLLKRYEEAQLADSLEQGQNGERFRVLDPAVAPHAPAAPNRLALLLMGLFGALAFAFATVFAAEKLDTSFHSVDDMRAFADVSNLAAIGLIVTKADIRRRNLRRPLLAALAVAGLLSIGVAARWVAVGNERIVRMVSGGQR